MKLCQSSNICLPPFGPRWPALQLLACQHPGRDIRLYHKHICTTACSAPLHHQCCMCEQGALRVNRFNPWEGYVGSESVGQDILLSGRAAMNRAIDGDIVAVELLPEEQWVRARTCLGFPPCLASGCMHLLSRLPAWQVGARAVCC